MGTAATRITVHSRLHIHDLKPEFAFPACGGGVLFPFSGMVLSTSAAILDFSGGYCDDGIATNWRPKSVRLSVSFPTDYLSGWSVSIPAVSSRGYAYNVSFLLRRSPHFYCRTIGCGSATSTSKEHPRERRICSGWNSKVKVTQKTRGRVFKSRLD